MSRKRVLVTGSSRGIGKAVALRLARQGWSVAMHFTANEEEAQNTMRQLGSSSSGIYQADLARPAEAKKLFEAVVKDGAIQALVNNAGVYMPMEMLRASDARFDATLYKTFAVNFESPLRLTRQAIRHFEKQGGGRIVNVASRVGFKGESGAALYAASKAALINLTRSLAMELAPHNIQLFGIAPGWVDTAMAREGMQDRLPSILKEIPLGRMATPEDCAATVGFLLSDEAAYLSGNVIDINGASYFH